MKEYCTNMYLSLKEELEQCSKKTSDIKRQIECSFSLCYTYWVTITKTLATYVFPSLEEEIIFFKETKPLFTCEIEYFNLLYHCELFKPCYSKKKCISFFSREKQRLDRFLISENLFYKYYKNGNTHLDEHYFTRTSHVESDILLKSYNLDLRLISPKDHLVSQIMALEKYTIYIETVLSDKGR